MAFYGAVMGGLVQLKCPHCGFVQVRGRRPPHTHMSCKRCLQDFAIADALPRTVATHRR